MTNELLTPFAKEILAKIGLEGHDEDDLKYLVDKLQFLQNDTIDACANIALGWSGQVRQWNLTGRMNDHDYKTNRACAAVIERNIRELKTPVAANQDPSPPEAA